jgi:hypothetical protein
MRSPQALGLISAAASNASSARVRRHKDGVTDGSTQRLPVYCYDLENELDANSFLPLLRAAHRNPCDGSIAQVTRLVEKAPCAHA